MTLDEYLHSLMLKCENGANQNVSHLLTLQSEAFQPNLLPEFGHLLNSGLLERLFKIPLGNFVTFILQWSISYCALVCNVLHILSGCQTIKCKQ